MYNSYNFIPVLDDHRGDGIADLLKLSYLQDELKMCVK